MGLHHVQLAMPPGEEDAASRFYGAILGLERIAKPDLLSPAGGVWFRKGDLEVHLGVEETSFTPAHKAHPAFLVADWRRSARGSRLRTGVTGGADRGRSGATELHLGVEDGFRDRPRRIRRAGPWPPRVREAWSRPASRWRTTCSSRAPSRDVRDPFGNRLELIEAVSG